MTHRCRRALRHVRDPHPPWRNPHRQRSHAGIAAVDRYYRRAGTGRAGPGQLDSTGVTEGSGRGVAPGTRLAGHTHVGRGHKPDRNRCLTNRARQPRPPAPHRRRDPGRRPGRTPRPGRPQGAARAERHAHARPRGARDGRVPRRLRSSSSSPRRTAPPRSRPCSTPTRCPSAPTSWSSPAARPARSP